MATIQKVKNKNGISYKVFIRNRGLKSIIKTFSKKQLATQFIHQIESDAQARVNYNNHSDKTFNEIVVDYFNNGYQGSRPKQQKSRAKYWLDVLGDRRIEDIVTSDISNGLSKLSADLSNATKNRYKAVVSVIFSYACRHYGLAHNPVQNIRSLPENNARIRFLSDNERTRLFVACRDSQWSKLHLLVLMAITTGARKGELLNLKFSNIDFVRKTAYVLTSKNGQPRVLPLTDEVINELNKFKHQEPRLIFNSELKTNKPMCFNKQWKKALSGAEINNFRFHDLRHSCASLLAQSGASLLEIAEVLGHKQIQVTKRYSHLCIDHKSKLINKVMGSL